MAQLIKNRWRLDESYFPLLEPETCPLSSSGVFPFSEPILCTYMDLDRLIESCGQSASERKVVAWIMQGYSMTDIAERHGTSRQTINAIFRRAVERVAEAARRRWLDVYGGGRGINKVGEGV